MATIKVAKIFVFLMEDEKGREGVINFTNKKSGISQPAIATSEERMKSMVPIANLVSDKLGKPYRVAEYLYSKDVIVRNPEKSSDQ